MYDTATHSNSTRRRFLRGVGGAVLALPLLESQVTAAEIAKPPRRLVASGVFFGLLPQHFHPQEVGADYTMPRLLKPLEPHRDQFTVFSGLDHNIGGGHTGTKYFLSGIPIEHSKGYSQLGRDSGGFDGVSHGYHSLSHHGKVESAIEELSIIESFFTSQFGRFVDALSAIKEPNGQTLLDNTMALFGSGMSNANSHSNRDLPVLLAGGGFRHGSHRHCARSGRKSVPLCNLYLSMLQHFGLEIDRFNTSSGTLSGLELA